MLFEKFVVSFLVECISTEIPDHSLCQFEQWQNSIIWENTYYHIITIQNLHFKTWPRKSLHTFVYGCVHGYYYSGKLMQTVGLKTVLISVHTKGTYSFRDYPRITILVLT